MPTDPPIPPSLTPYNALLEACKNINTTSLDVFIQLTNNHEEERLNRDETGLHSNSPRNYLEEALQLFNKSSNVDIILHLLRTFHKSDWNGGDLQRLQKLLQIACVNHRNLSLEVFRYIIEGFSPDYILPQDSDLHRMIEYYTSSTDINILKYLLTLPNIDINKGETRFQSLFQNICYHYDRFSFSFFEFLVQNGADVCIRDGTNDNPIAIVLKKFSAGHDIQIVKYLFSQPQVDVNYRIGSGPSLFDRFCAQPELYSIELFEYLIKQKGADVNSSHTPQTPFQNVLLNFRKGRHDLTIIEYFLSFRTVDRYETHTAFILSLSMDLRVACDNINGIPMAIFTKLISLGANVDYICPPGNKTPLFIAIQNFSTGSNVGLLTLLLNASTLDPHYRCSDGDTLLLKASQNIENIPLSIFKYIIEKKGCELNVFNRRHDSPLHYASTTFLQNPDAKVSPYIFGQYGLTIGPTTINGDNSRIIDQPDEFVQFVADENLIKNPIDARKFISWLSHNTNGSLSAIQLALVQFDTHCDGLGEVWGEYLRLFLPQKLPFYDDTELCGFIEYIIDRQINDF
jgi:hypothetical protein